MSPKLSLAVEASKWTPYHSVHYSVHWVSFDAKPHLTIDKRLKSRLLCLMHWCHQLCVTVDIPPLISNNLFFQFTLELHKVWQQLCAVLCPESKQFTVCGSSCSLVVATFIYFISFCVTNYFHLHQVFCSPSHQIMAMPLVWPGMLLCSLERLSWTVPSHTN